MCTAIACQMQIQGERQGERVGGLRLGEKVGEKRSPYIRPSVEHAMMSHTRTRTRMHGQCVEHMPGKAQDSQQQADAMHRVCYRKSSQQSYQLYCKS